MSNRGGILDSHPSERVKMPPELAAFAPALAPAAGADNSNATVNL